MKFRPHSRVEFDQLNDNVLLRNKFVIDIDF